jgi:hypothetical protein
MPFALIGGLIAWRVWHELPAATRKYIEEVERSGDPALLRKASALDQAEADEPEQSAA